MNRRIASVWCSAALIAVLLPAGAMAAKHPAKGQLKEAVKSGKLTRQDAKQLKADRKALRTEVKAAKANGTISPEERARLKAERARLRDAVNAQTN